MTVTDKEKGEFVAPRYDYTDEPVAAQRRPEKKTSNQLAGRATKEFVVLPSAEGIRIVGIPEDALVRFLPLTGETWASVEEEI